ncbi:MAG: ABC transporter ATP-binding protein [Gallicola sp.]|nr:ABC transporter ATP-binding protein [Gallicola sp.]
MLKIDGLKKVYGDFQLDLSMEVPTGQITGLIGRNGAGKTTAFKAILGLIKKDFGRILLFNKDVEKINAEDKKRLGVVLSDSGFSNYYTVKDIMDILQSFYDNFDKNHFEYLIHNYGLPKDKKLKEFSTGMNAKLKLAVAISHNADLLILDEPTAGLDVIARGELLEILREFMEKDENKSILISSHISSDLENLCDYIYMIDEGKIVFYEDTDILLSNYAVLKVDDLVYNNMDKKYILKKRSEGYGYSLLTNEKRFYVENYPGIVIEKGNIDELMNMMIRGENI